MISQTFKVEMQCADLEIMQPKYDYLPDSSHPTLQITSEKSRARNERGFFESE